MPKTPESLAAIAVQPPVLAVNVVESAVREQFGLSGEFRPLISERDQNFRLDSDDGSRFVVKVVSRADSAELVDFQIAALKHLEKRRFDCVPRVVDSLGGAPVGEVLDRDGETLVLRVVTWVDGTPQRSAELSDAAARHFGASIAEFDEAMAGFDHRGANQRLLWDMQRAPELLLLTEHIDDDAIRSNVEGALTDFVERAEPVLSSLPKQVIHNDLNGGNVLFDGDRLVGIIDFGDMLAAPRIVDVAIAASYLRDTARPLRLIEPLLDGYATRTSIDDAERDVLFDLIRARLCATISILYWRMSERAADDPYRQKAIAEESGASEYLDALNRLGREEFERGVLNS